MALEIDTLVRNKRNFNPSPDSANPNYGIWDLTEPSITYQGIEPLVKDFTVVSEYFQMRADLIAALKMGSHNSVGSLLKFNGISNPFSIKEGQVLAIPDTQMVQDSFNSRQLLSQKSPSVENRRNPLNEFRKNQEQKTFKISEGRKKFLDNRIKNPPNMVLPTNVTQPSERSSVSRNGYSILAPDSGGGGFNSPETV